MQLRAMAPHASLLASALSFYICCAGAAELRGHRRLQDHAEWRHELTSASRPSLAKLQQEFVDALRPCAPCQSFKRFGEEHDGGYVMCEDDLGHGLVGALSYGINGFDGWGMAVASRFGIQLHEYDCFNATKPRPCAGCKVQFHSECIQSLAFTQNLERRRDFKTLSAQLSENGLASAGERSLLLKLDVEGAEWNILASEPMETLRKMRQIVVEFHEISPDSDFRQYLQAFQKLEAAGFAVAHVHGNNCCRVAKLNGFEVPSFLEVTFVPAPSDGCRPGLAVHLPMDSTNVPDKPEVEVVLPVRK